MRLLPQVAFTAKNIDFFHKLLSLPRTQTSSTSYFHCQEHRLLPQVTFTAKNTDFFHKLLSLPRTTYPPESKINCLNWYMISSYRSKTGKSMV